LTEERAFIDDLIDLVARGLLLSMQDESGDGSERYALTEAGRQALTREAAQ
jgi:DNA-binding PadR family transcriptional regulator